MPTFETPQPIQLSIDVPHGEAAIAASDRDQTIVQVLARRPKRTSDVRAAQQTTVEFAAGVLTIRTPNGWPRYSFFGGGAVDIVVQLPTGSALQGESSLGSFTCTGLLGDVHLSSSMGSIRLEQAEALWVRTSHGSVHADCVRMDADVATSTGQIRLGQVGGTVQIRNSNGNTSVDLSGRDLRAKSANGSIEVGYARGSVVAKTANGNVRLHHVESGNIDARTSSGDVEIGIVPDTKAWLDVGTNYGRVRNSMAAAQAPMDGTAVEVRAHTNFGDVIVHPAPIADQ